MRTNPFAVYILTTRRNTVLYTGVTNDLGRRLANSRVWPEWKPGAEFKAERDKTKAQRK